MSETHITEYDECSLMLFGLGGQGMQLAGKILARAAVAEGHYAMVAADYGGEMRGGPSNAAVVLGTEPITALPILPRTETAVVAHPQFSGTVPDRLDSDGLLLLNTSVAHSADLPATVHVVTIAATDLALEVGAAQATGLVLLGAINTLVGAVSPDTLHSAMEEAVPAHRAKLLPTNHRALDLGAAAVASQCDGATARNRTTNREHATV